MPKSSSKPGTGYSVDGVLGIARKLSTNLTVGEVFDISEAVPSEIFDAVYESLSEEERAEIDQVQRNIEEFIPYFGPLRFKELIVKLGIFMVR